MNDIIWIPTDTPENRFCDEIDWLLANNLVVEPAEREKALIYTSDDMARRALEPLTRETAFALNFLAWRVTALTMPVLKPA